MENAEVWSDPALKKVLLFYIKLFFFPFALLNVIILGLVSPIYKVAYMRIS